METHGFAILHTLIYSKSHSKLLGATVKVRIRLFALGHILPRVLGLVTWHRHVTIRTTPSQPHVFVCRPECVNDSLVLGIVVKQITQCKEGMFPQV